MTRSSQRRWRLAVADAGDSLRQRLAAGPDPTWSKAPFLLLRAPSSFVAITLAAFILAVASAASPMFLASAGGVAVRQQVDRSSPWKAGLTVVVYGPVTGSVAVSEGPSVPAAGLLRRRDEALRSGAALPHLGDAVLSMLGSRATASAGQGGRSSQVQLLSRTGFLQHVHRLDEVAGSGLWVSDVTARALGLQPGDELTLSVRTGAVHIPVAGIYRDLVAAGPLDDYWSVFAGSILPPPGGARPPPLLLADRDLFVSISARFGDLDQFTWQFPVQLEGLGLPEAQGLAGDLQSLGTSLEDPLTPLGRLFADGTNTTQLSDLVTAATATFSGLQVPVVAVSVAGRLVALAVIAAAGLYAIARRRNEVRALSARGVGGGSLAVKGALEALAPVVLGSVGGWAAAAALVRTLGPGGPVGGSARASATWQVAGGAVVGLALLAMVAAGSGRAAEDTGTARLQRVLARTPWEVLVLLLAAASFSELVLRGSGPVRQLGGTPQVDVFLLLFPVLFIAGTAGLISRLLGRALPRLPRRHRRKAGPAWRYLASRRLAASSRMALLLVTASALAIGILAYAGTVTASVRATTTAKAEVLAGSRVAVPLGRGTRVPKVLPGPHTIVDRIPDGSIVPSGLRVDLLGVDRSTFAGAAAWDPGFSRTPLSNLLRALEPQGTARLPVLVAGGRPGRISTIELIGEPVPVTVAGSVPAFPGMRTGRPTLVADREGLARVVSRATGRTIEQASGSTELWVNGDPSAVLASLRSSGVPVAGAITVERIRSTPSFLAVSWIFGLLEALGILAGIVALAGLLLYLQARQAARDVAYALSSRMGLSRTDHRRSIAAELSAMLAGAFAIGVGLAYLAARLVYARLDLLPQIPPAPVLSVPLPLLGLAFVVLMAAAMVGTWAAQRAADRANIGEVLRVAA